MSPDVTQKTAILKKLWDHPKTKEALANYKPQFWLFDGRKLAWSSVPLDRGEVRFSVDLDGGKPVQANRKGGSNLFYVTIRQTTEIKIAALQGYLDRKIDFNNVVQEALNFLDHLIRETPSKNLLAIKRNFYHRNGSGRRLMDGSIVEVHQGTYASLRLSHNLAHGGIGMALNADVSNTCFWTGKQTADQLICHYLASCERRWYALKPSDLAKELRPVNIEGRLGQSDAFKHLRKFRKLRFTVRHSNRAAAANDKVYTIQDFTFDPKYGPEGVNAKNKTFPQDDGKEISVVDYYGKKYAAFLRYPFLPLIDAGKGGFIPMEFAWIEPMQRYAFKLNPDQTAAMIKIAVTRPEVRKQNIQRQMSYLDQANDPVLAHYGAHFETEFTKTQARLLPAPTVNFSVGTATPGTSGRWDLRGKRFWKSNVVPLLAWGFVVMDNCVALPQLQQFAKTFRTTFVGHGGICSADPLLLNAPGDIKTNPAQVVSWAHGQITNSKKMFTQLLFVVVQHRNSPHYIRLKKSGDCRFGILTQVVNGGHVAKNSGQYHSNICLKVNAKLGGATSRTMPPWKTPGTYFPRERPTMIIGVDISHAAPGGDAASTAAMTMSIDPDATRYAAVVESNGYRVEMLTPSNVQMMIGKLSNEWKKEHGNSFPAHIIYFRDGVAEGQFAHVIEQEVQEMKSFFQRVAGGKPIPKFTVIIATKRHHIRLFPLPNKGDRNGNVLPGTLVERDVTHPFMFDFYLNSHAAIQGTARPVHYHVIMDEMNCPVNDLQKMIYYQCYSYARSTTPVSLHPAVYYAHLACNRARAHEATSSTDSARTGSKGHEMIREQESQGLSSVNLRNTAAPALLPLGGRPESAELANGEAAQRRFLPRTMWYI